MSKNPTNVPPTKEFIRNSLQYGLSSDSDLEDRAWFRRNSGSLNPEAAYLVGRNRSRIARLFINFAYKNRERILSIPMLRSLALYTKDRLMKNRNNMTNQRAIDFSSTLELGVDEFIQNLYLRALGRMPDEQSFENAKQAMCLGLPKEGLIYLVCTSDEFANRAPVVHLSEYSRIYSRYILRERIKRLPIIGLPFQIRAMERQMANLFLSMESTKAKLESGLESTKARLESGLESTNAKLDIANQNIIYANVKIDRVMDRITKQVVYGVPGGITVIHTEKFIFGVPSEEWRLVSYLSSGGTLEPATEKYFCSILAQDMIVLDIGANIGVYTLHALAAGCQVYSYEPTPKTYKILKDNIGINGFEPTGRAHTYNVAVSDSDGEVQFNVFDTSGHNSMYSEDESLEVIHVKTVCLDNHLRSLERVDVVKIDVEGAEPLVLQGMKGIIANNPTIKIIMEFGPSNLERGGTDPCDFLKTIRSMGLDIHAIEESSGRIMDVSDEDLCRDYSVNLLLEKNIFGG